MAFSSADPNAYVALAMQSGLGTKQTTPAKYRFAKYAAGNTFNVVPAVVDVREGGDGLDIGSTYKRGQVVEGTLVFNGRPEIAGQVLQINPGGATWNGGSAPAIHTFHTNHASIPWAGLQIAYPGTDIIHLFADVKFTGMQILGRAGQPIQFTIPWRGIFHGASSGIALTPSYAENQPFWVYHFTPSILINGAADSTIEEYMIDAQFGTEDLYAQDVKPDDIAILNRTINFRATKRYVDPTLWKLIAYNGGIAPTQTVPSGSFSAYHSYYSGGSQMSIKFDIGQLSYRGNSLTDLNPDGVTVRETVQAAALKTASSIMTITLNNQHASAYAP